MMTHEEHIELAKQAFINKGFWPNTVMWECWKDAWLAGVAALAEPAKESLTTANPVAWMSTKMAGVVIAHQPEDFQRHPDRWQPLYAAQMLLPATEYICKCGLRVTPHRCKTDMEF